MAIRLNFIVEGQTEETFVNNVLRNHLADFAISSTARCVATSRRRNIKHRGGIPSYEYAQQDIRQWLRNDRNSDARFTTMFDLYRLPADFPGSAATVTNPNPYNRVNALEDALATDINDWRFIPYLQLHEFETLLLADPLQLGAQFPGYDDAISRLAAMVSAYPSAELINDGEQTAPSKRIIAEIPAYGERKPSAGPITAGKIGLHTLRSSCAHFEQWLSRLESLGADS